MDEEYFKIREALIKLLCVGDEINIIYSFKDNNPGLRAFSIIKKCIVVKLNDRHIKVQSTLYNSFIVEISEIEAYEGKLYIWENKDPHSVKMKEMIKIIESKGTSHL
jgi:hypothetical protein